MSHTLICGSINVLKLVFPAASVLLEATDIPEENAIDAEIAAVANIR